jgi:hypothetical protein
MVETPRRNRAVVLARNYSQLTVQFSWSCSTRSSFDARIRMGIGKETWEKLDASCASNASRYFKKVLCQEALPELD